MSKIWDWITGTGGAQRRRDQPKVAILALREQLEMLQKRSSLFEERVQEQLELAKNYAGQPNTRESAKKALRRKIELEAEKKKTETIIENVEKQISNIEMAIMNKSTLETMDRTQQALSAIHHGLTPESVDRTMDKLREQTELSEEITNAITSIPLENQVDEAELDRELEDLEQQAQEELNERVLSSDNVAVSDPVYKFPAAGTKKPQKSIAAQQDEEEEEELRKLQAEMAM